MDAITADGHYRGLTLMPHGEAAFKSKRKPSNVRRTARHTECLCGGPRMRMRGRTPGYCNGRARFADVAAVRKLAHTNARKGFVVGDGFYPSTTIAAYEQKKMLPGSVFNSKTICSNEPGSTFIGLPRSDGTSGLNSIRA